VKPIAPYSDKKVSIAICALMLATTGTLARAQQPAYQSDQQAYPPFAQTTAQQMPPQQQAPPPQLMGPEQLNDLVAPIALYPDPLLGQILVAATYPLEIVEASQWLQANGGLRGPALIDAAKQQPWDPSIKTLVATPEVLMRLAQNVRWTTDLGNAFLAQQGDVMNAVQTMRARAQRRGQLYSSPQETVTNQDIGGQQAIGIQPADPQELYVPEYNPAYVYGPPAWGYYPPLYYPAGFFFGPPINFGFLFGGWGGWGVFGWGPNWFARTILLNGLFFGRHFGGVFGFGAGYHGSGYAVWAHDPGHRMGVAYPTRQLAARYQGASLTGRGSAFTGRGLPQSTASNFGNRPSTAYPSTANRGSTAGAANVHSYAPSAPSAAGAARSYAAPQAGASAPRSSYQAAPRAPSYSAPRSSGSSTPHYSAPSHSSGGSSHVSSGGGHHR
jgi:hypothetical protein